MGYPEPMPSTNDWTWLLYLRNKQTNKDRVIATSDGALVSCSESLLSYSCWTAGGNSGGPVVQYHKDRRATAIAIHIRGEEKKLNWGVKINAEIFSKINTYFRESWAKHGYVESALSTKFQLETDTIYNLVVIIFVLFRSKFLTLSNQPMEDTLREIRDEIEKLNWIQDIFHLVQASADCEEEVILRWEQDLNKLLQEYQNAINSMDQG